MGDIAEVIQIAEERFNSIAPAHMKYDAEKGFAIQLLKNNPYLMQAAQQTPKTLQQAITNVAAIGLSLNPAEKLAYLITRNVKVTDPDGRERWESRIYLEPSYMGLIRLATDSGSIEWCKADCVHEADDFVDNGPGEKPTHTYNAFKDRGAIVGVYCTAKTCKSDYLTTTMPLDDLISIRNRSEAWKAKAAGKRKHGGPWESDFKEMAKKTVIRNAFKTWPRTNERRMALMAQAVNISNENEGFEPIETTPKLSDATPAQKEFFDRLIETGDAFEMYMFEQSIREQNESMWTSLYHSFPKGEKGKYQAIVNDLTARGASMFADVVDSLRAALEANDDSAASEIVSELSNDALERVKGSLSSEEIKILSEIYNAA